MSIVSTAVILVGVGSVIVHQNSPAARLERRCRIKELSDKRLEPSRKKKIRLNSSQNLLMKFLNFLIMRQHN